MFSEALAQRLVSVSADIADLRAWKQSVYLYERLVLPCAFIAELPQNLAPACIADLPCQIWGSAEASFGYRGFLHRSKTVS